jgi:hypothetical protein
MPRILAIAAAALALAVPTTASAAVRTGLVEDPQGDVSSLSGEQVDDLRSMSVAYDDAAGTLRVISRYWTDLTLTPRNSYVIAAMTLEDAHLVDGAEVSVWIDKAPALNIQPTLQLWGVSGTIAGTGQVSDNGHTLTVDFSHAALVAHDWQQAVGGVPGGDRAARFWFDGYSPPPSGGTGGGGPPGPGPDDSRVGMTINRGARYTNDTHVNLSVVVPSWARTIKISNDGGFLAAREKPAARTIQWTLDSSGPERLPKTVYVRFGSSTQTYTDDIILDETSPVVSSATFAGPGTGTAGAVAAAAVHAYRVRLRAKDATSGVSKVQFAVSKRRPIKRLYTYKRVVRYNGARAPRFVRVRDLAGNLSKWRAIRRR